MTAPDKRSLLRGDSLRKIHSRTSSFRSGTVTSPEPGCRTQLVAESLLMLAESLGIFFVVVNTQCSHHVTTCLCSSAVIESMHTIRLRLAIREYRCILTAFKGDGVRLGIAALLELMTPIRN
jgi:hypothetical protein